MARINELKAGLEKIGMTKGVRDAILKEKLENEKLSPDCDPYRVDYASKIKREVCRTYAYELDLQKMHIEGVDEEKVKDMENRLWMQDFSLIKEEIGVLRTCEGSVGIELVPYKDEDTNKWNIFVKPVKINEKPLYHFGKLVQITVRGTDEYSYKNGYGYLQSTYTLKKGKVKVLTEGVDKVTGDTVPYEEWDYEFTRKRTLKLPFIPVTVFKNNFESKGELENDEDLLAELNLFKKLVKDEMIMGSTTLVTSGIGRGADVEKIRHAITYGTTRLIATNTPDSMFGTPVTSIATQGKIPEMMTALKETKNELYNFINFPVETEDAGKNNKHNLEISQKQGRARANLEAKKIIVHKGYFEFHHMYMSMSAIYKMIKFTKEEITNFELIWEDTQVEAEMQEQNDMAKDQNKVEAPQKAGDK